MGRSLGDAGNHRSLLQNPKLIAKVGDTAKRGQPVALRGTTGNSTGCHVHFEVLIVDPWNDPQNFLPTIPGQPNPMIDSRRTTSAEPIRNTEKLNQKVAVGPISRSPLSESEVDGM